jgi:hypothetical protein
LKKCWVIPPKENARFVAQMEDVLEVYQRPHNSRRPVICLDEACKQLTSSTRASLAARPGQIERTDYEYERHGQANMFMLFAPLEAWREVLVRQTRNAVDYAHIIRHLVDVCFPDADKIVLVQDNLSTHQFSSLYQAFAPAEALRLAQKLEIHYTPVHGSWLNMAEIELSVLAKQCLGEHVSTLERLRSDVQAWEKARNDSKNTVNWRFTTDDARVKLKRLYPSVLPG